MIILFASPRVERVETKTHTVVVDCVADEEEDTDGRKDGGAVPSQPLPTTSEESSCSCDK